MNLTQLAQATGLPIATTHRLAKELAASGLLERNPDGTYQVGARVWELGALAPRPNGLASVAHPFLNRLHRATGEFVQLAALEGTGLLVIDRVRGRHSVANISDPGRILPLHASSVGKVHLAFAAPGIVERVLSERLPRYTPRTIVDAEGLQKQLDRVAAEGVAHAREELTVGTVAVAAPVFDAEGELAAAVGILTRPGASLARLAAPVLTAATDITRALGRRTG